jgi:hypothetical protein
LFFRILFLAGFLLFLFFFLDFRCCCW